MASLSSRQPHLALQRARKDRRLNRIIPVSDLMNISKAPSRLHILSRENINLSETLAQSLSATGHSRRLGRDPAISRYPVPWTPDGQSGNARNAAAQSVGGKVGRFLASWSIRSKGRQLLLYTSTAPSTRLNCNVVRRGGFNLSNTES